MMLTRYFTVDSVVQPVQPAASSAVADEPDDTTVAFKRNDTVIGFNRDRNRMGYDQTTNGSQTTDLTASSSQYSTSPVQHPPTQVHQQSMDHPVLQVSATITIPARNTTSSEDAHQAYRKRYSVTDLMDKLLEDIYRVSGSSVASESSTDQTNWSDGGGGGPKIANGWSKRLSRKSVEELSTTVDLLRDQLNVCCETLVKALKRRDILIARRDAKCNMITALLHAYSMKRNGQVFEPPPQSSRPQQGDNRSRRKNRNSLSKHISKTGDVMNGLLNTLKNIASLSEDTKMRFNMKPGPGDSDFEQWQSAMKMVARLPDGVPHEFRNTLWLTLAEKYLSSRNIDWSKVERVCFNDTTNPDDEELGVQIVKDLHRTGCSLFCGSSGLENQALLKRVLLGFARWNKAVGYCQGFNMLAALILQVMEKNESDALKVMIYLIEGVLPEGYFANNLRGLSVDMAVFRDLLRVRLQNLSRHLDRLQNESKDSGTSYEPPLTNVFTMQWFLTLFCNCLPQRTVLRVWDLIFLEGSTVLLKTALAMWDALSDRIMTVTSADEFYSIMAVLTREMLEFGLMDANNLINTISTMNELVEVKELRERYMYNINPWVSHMAKRGLRLFYAESDVEETDSDDDVDGRSVTVGGASSDRKDGSRTKNNKTGSSKRQPVPSLESEREKVALDISSLKKQYCKLKERQKQVQVILTAACNGQNFIGTSNSSAMNHLLFGKTALRCTSMGPIPGSIPLKYIQDVKKAEPKIEPRIREKRAKSPCSSSSSTSTELCDDPAVSDFGSDRSAENDDLDEDNNEVCNDCDRNLIDDDENDCDRNRVNDAIIEIYNPEMKSDLVTASGRYSLKLTVDGPTTVSGRYSPEFTADGSTTVSGRYSPELTADGSMAVSGRFSPELTADGATISGRRSPEVIASAPVYGGDLKLEGSIDDYDDVSLAEVLRANSEMLNRMCRGNGGAAGVSPETTTVADLEKRLPDMINDIDVLGESMADRRDSFPDQPSTTPPHRPEAGRDVLKESVKPFAPFPSKVRQHKRLGIELGLYPEDSN